MVLTIREAAKAVEEGTSDDYVEGHEEVLQDLAEWLAKSYDITAEELKRPSTHAYRTEAGPGCRGRH